jgi:hypothetical protein
VSIVPDPLETFRGDSREPSPEAIDRVTKRLTDRLASLPPDEEGRRPFDDRRGEPARVARPSRRVLALAAVAVLAPLTLGMAMLLTRDSVEEPVPVAQLSAMALERPDRPLDESEYHYRVEESAPPGENQPVLRIERWITTDGSGREARTTRIDAGAPGVGPDPTVTARTGADPLDFAGLSYAELRALPTDPTALLQRLEDHGLISRSDESGTAATLAELLSFEITEPAVRAAAIDALELIGGRSVGTSDDGSGRRGVAVMGDNPDGTHWVMVMDPGTTLARAFHPRTTWIPSSTATLPLHRRWQDQAVVATLP